MRSVSVLSGHFWPRLVLFLCSCALILLAGGAVSAQRAAAAGSHVDVFTLADDISPSSLRELNYAVDTAQSDGAEALIIQLDTPGGDLDSMKAMTQKELAATVPIVVYVSPAGGRAASAGTFVTLAAPIAAMAPTTRIGAASPVDINGGDIPSTLKAKITNDLVAQMQGLCQRYDRKCDLAVKAITDAAAYDDQTAIAAGMVDLGAANMDDLLSKIDGREVTLGNGQLVTLHTADATQQTIQPRFIDSFIGLLLDPNIAFILLVLAGIGIYIEISHPGLILPGVVGAISLVLFLFTAGTLSTNWAGLLLVVVAFVLLILDVRLPSHGALTIGALIALVVGSLLFFNDTGNIGAPSLNPFVLGIMVSVVAALALLVLVGVIRSQRLPVTTGKEGLIGQVATVTETLAPAGRVKVWGEDWAARQDAPALYPVEVGRQVRILGVSGLTLIVEPIVAVQPHEIEALPPGEGVA
ncbi:MAG TPA: nodulation protein NfeD [Ktedonobacterales bacterium]|jgi:membrane-bound serine protease (ClpP class)